MSGMKNILCIFCLLFAFPVSASVIPEGAIVKTADNPDVYIVKYSNGKQYKRLVLNPSVFESYRHLKWGNLLTITDAELDAFTTADLVRVDGSPAVYQLVADVDNGGKFLLTSFEGYDLDSVYTINETDFNNYVYVGSRGAKTMVTENIADGQESVSGVEAAVLKAELERRRKVLAVFDELDLVLRDVNGGMSDLLDRMDTKLEEMEFIRNDSGLTQTDRNARLVVAYSEYGVSADAYDVLSDKKSRIATIIQELDGYANCGTVISAADRAYLSSLGVVF